jgi:hypothetical protein
VGWGRIDQQAVIDTYAKVAQPLDEIS